MLSGKKVVLGISGGIAAYKTTFLVRLLIKAGAEVKVILTESAGSFVSPLTLAALSGNPALTSFVEEDKESVQWNNHVDLGIWADLMIIAPATANTLSKMAAGSCDNLLLAVYLSARCPVFFAPAMDLDMFKHAATKASLRKLEDYGHILIPAGTGELASGLIGEGRMAEPEEIMESVLGFLRQGLPLQGKKVLITAGPTYEAIDPVRFIGNFSTGVMGFELARSAARLGAEVSLITGPTAQTLQHTSVSITSVVSAEEMLEAARKRYHEMDIVICAAAVADYRPTNRAGSKLKKEQQQLTLELTQTTDILYTLGSMKNRQFLVGFALETDDEIENAKRKMHKKNLDAIVLNSLNDKGAGFGTATNKISFIDKNSSITTFELKNKAAVATDIWNEILDRYHA